MYTSASGGEDDKYGCYLEERLGFNVVPGDFPDEMRTDLVLCVDPTFFLFSCPVRPAPLTHAGRYPAVPP